MTYRYKQPLRTPCMKCNAMFVRSSHHNKLCPKCFKKALSKRPESIKKRYMNAELKMLRAKIKEIKQNIKEANKICLN